MSSTRNNAKLRNPDPTGVAEIDRLATLSSCGIQDYIAGVSAYVRLGPALKAGPKKAAQIRLSNALARSLASELTAHLPQLKGQLVTDEQRVAGGLRTANSDVTECHHLDGLRLAIELKPINLAVGRAIWNRFGDIRTFAVNIHLKFPFAIVGGVLVIPTYERIGTTAAREAEHEEAAAVAVAGDAEKTSDSPETPVVSTHASTRKSTLHLVERAVERLTRAGGRKTEAEAAHLLEGIAVVVYDPDTATLLPDVPKVGSGLRWSEFVTSLVTSYRARFED